MIVEFLVVSITKIVIYLVLLVAILWLLKELTMGICLKGICMKDKTVVITGGHEGIGLEVVLALAKRQAKIVIGCQNVANVKDKILQHIPDADVDVMWLDLSSKDRIIHFTKEIKSKYKRIHLLINNASFVPKKAVHGGTGGRRSGAFAKGRRTKTADGFELVMGENYFGHVLLNHLLLPIIKESNQTLQSINEDNETVEENPVNQSSFTPRIIVMSSPMAFTPWANHLYLNNDFQFEDSMKNPLIQYSKSKLAQLMYAKHLSKSLRKENNNAIIIVSYPGFVIDSLSDYVPLKYQKAFSIFFKMFGKNSWQAAQTCIHLSFKDFSNDIDYLNGKMFIDCRENQWFIPNLAKNEYICQKLWDKTEEMLGLKNL